MNSSIPPLPAPQPREEAIQAAVLAATRAFHRREASRPLSQLEFLRQQNRFLHKRWWVLQAGVLGLLWWLLQISGSTAEVQRAMGTLAPLFVVLVLPGCGKTGPAAPWRSSAPPTTPCGRSMPPGCFSLVWWT